MFVSFDLQNCTWVTFYVSKVGKRSERSRSWPTGRHATFSAFPCQRKTVNQPTFLDIRTASQPHPILTYLSDVHYTSIQCVVRFLKWPLWLLPSGTRRRVVRKISANFLKKAGASILRTEDLSNMFLRNDGAFIPDYAQNPLRKEHEWTKQTLTHLLSSKDNNSERISLVTLRHSVA